MGHIGEEPDPSTEETCGGAGNVIEGSEGTKALWVLKVGIGVVLRVLLSGATLEIGELELSHATSEVTKLHTWLDLCKDAWRISLDLLLLTAHGASIGKGDSGHGCERKVDGVRCRVLWDDICPYTGLESCCKA